MLKLTRGSSNIPLSSTGYECSPKSRREAQKRKGVRLADDLNDVDGEPHLLSTSTFLRQRGMAWNSLAKTFGCDDECGSDDSVVMNELLNLCSFWAESEPIFVGPSGHSDEETDSDDDDLESFEQYITKLSPPSCSNSRFSQGHRTSSSFVNSLHFKSLLQLNNQSCRSSVDQSETLNSTSKSPCQFNPSSGTKAFLTVGKCSSTAKELENAFKGVVVDDNSVCHDTAFANNTTTDDFWSQVEF